MSGEIAAAATGSIVSGTSTASTLAYLSRVLKTPTIGRVWESLAVTARQDGWSHEEYLAAVLQRQVADREVSRPEFGGDRSVVL